MKKKRPVDTKTLIVKPTSLNQSKRENKTMDPIKQENRTESFKKHIFKHPLEMPVVNSQTNKGLGGWKKKYSVNINGTIGDRLKNTTQQVQINVSRIEKIKSKQQNGSLKGPDLGRGKIDNVDYEHGGVKENNENQIAGQKLENQDLYQKLITNPFQQQQVRSISRKYYY